MHFDFNSTKNLLNVLMFDTVIINLVFVTVNDNDRLSVCCLPNTCNYRKYVKYKTHQQFEAQQYIIQTN